MKKLSLYIFLGLLLQGCEFINPKTYLSCYRAASEADKAFGIPATTIFAFDRNYLYDGWDPYEQKLRHKKEADIGKRYIKSKGYTLNRETGKIRLNEYIGYEWDCKKNFKESITNQKY